MFIDTSVWIDFFNGYSSAEADYLDFAIKENQPIDISGLVLIEILVGVSDNKKAARIINLFQDFNFVIEPSRLDYIEAANLYRNCRKKGLTIRSIVDCLIGQICLRDNLILLTKDRDFKSMAKCAPLRLVNVL